MGASGSKRMRYRTTAEYTAIIDKLLAKHPVPADEAEKRALRNKVKSALILFDLMRFVERGHEMIEGGDQGDWGITQAVHDAESARKDAFITAASALGLEDAESRIAELMQ
jgi:hypothetical protein